MEVLIQLIVGLGMNNFMPTAIPLFILMAEMMQRSGGSALWLPDHM